MGTSLYRLCLHLAIIICLSVSLSGNTVTPNTTILDSTSLPESQDTSTTKSTTLSDTTSSVTETSSITKLMKEAKDKSTKPLVLTDATKLPSETETSTASSSKSSSPTSTSSKSPTTLSTSTTSSKSPTSSSTSNATQPNTTSSATTSAPSTPTTASTTVTPIEAITDGAGINAIKVQGKKKRLSLADIANTPSTTTTTDKPTSSRPNRKTGKKKKKRRPSRRPKKQKGSSQTTTRTPDGTSKTQAPTLETQKPSGPGKVPALPLTTAYPLSPDATIHKVEAGVEPVLFAAVAADNKKGGGGKKAGKKGAKKNGKAQGKKGDTGPPGPAGPKGAKGEPGDAAESSMKMQAASSAVLTEHFGPDKDVIVPFDLKLIDLADNYDNTTGVFICTIPGVYVVSLYLMSHPGAKVNARVFINSRPIAALWADDSKNSGFYPSSSIQTVSQLAFGDQVYVMLVDGGYGESWVHANYNAFSLFLLYEDVFFRK